MKNFRLIIIVFLLIANFMLAFSASAGWVADIINASSRGRLSGELIPEGCRVGKQETAEKCGLEELFEIVVKIAYLILGLVGTLALAMFVYGGIMFLISAGNQEKVQKAKGILTNAAIGIVIVFSAWMIVNFIILALTQGRAGLGNVGNIFNQPWTAPPG